MELDFNILRKNVLYVVLSMNNEKEDKWKDISILFFKEVWLLLVEFYIIEKK